MADIRTIWPGWDIVEMVRQTAYGKVYRICRKEEDRTIYGALEEVRVPADKSDKICGWLRELKVMKNVNVPLIEDFVQTEEENGSERTIFIRTDLLQTLSEYVRKEGFPNQAETVRIGRDIGAALECFEKKKIVHGSVNPENIYRGEDGTYKLGGWGIEGLLAAERAGGYLAPEVCRGGQCDRKSDIYSLGMIMYRFLNKGKMPVFPPIQADTGEPAEPWQGMEEERAYTAPEDASPALAAVILKACHPNPAKRYPGAKSFLEALEALESGTPRVLSRADSGVSVHSAAVRGKKSKNKSRTVVAAIAVIAVLCFILIAAVGLMPEKSIPESGQTAASGKGDILVNSTVMIEGDRQWLRFNVDGMIVTYSDQLKYTSSDESVIAVVVDPGTKEYAMEAKGPGTAEISAVMEGFTGSVTMFVADRATAGGAELTVSPDDLSIASGGEADLTLTVSGEEIPEKYAVLYYSSPGILLNYTSDGWRNNELPLKIRDLASIEDGYVTFILVDSGKDTEAIAYTRASVEIGK